MEWEGGERLKTDTPTRVERLTQPCGLGSSGDTNCRAARDSGCRLKHQTTKASVSSRRRKELCSSWHTIALG